MDLTNPHADSNHSPNADPAIEYQPEKRLPLDTVAFFAETLQSIVEPLAGAPKIELGDDNLNATFGRMPIFQQKNEFCVAYMELTQDEIVRLGRAVFENRQTASAVNHINFCGNQFSTEQFTLFCHLVVAPILYFSGCIAISEQLEKSDSEISTGSANLSSEIQYAFRLRQTAGLAVGYAAPDVIRNASSGFGSNFGVTGIECDNNGASTDGWKVLVGVLSGADDVFEEGEKIRSKYLALPGDETATESKVTVDYTLRGAARATLSISEECEFIEEETMGHILTCTTHHLTTLANIDISENYIHDIGALYASILITSTSNLRVLSLITNQMTARAAKDLVKAFEARLEEQQSSFDNNNFPGGEYGQNKISAVPDSAAMALVERKVKSEGDDDCQNKLISKKALAAILSSIVKSTRLVAHHGSSSPGTNISPAERLEYPYCVPSYLIEAGHLHCLKQLFLDYNSLGDEGVEELVQTIGYKCPSIQKLGLSDNRIGDRGAKAIATHIIANPACHVQHLNLSVNVIGDEGFIALAKALSCAYVVSGAGAGRSAPPYELKFKTPVRFDRPAAHYYDTDSDLLIDELRPAIKSGLGSYSHGIPVAIVAEEQDGEDGLGEGPLYLEKLSFSESAVTLTQRQVELLLLPRGETEREQAINTRLYHLDVANQSNRVQERGRTAMLTLAFAYKYIMTLDVTAIGVENAEMRLLPRAMKLGAKIATSDLTDASPWLFTCGIVNCEWYNNPSIFPQTEELVGKALEASIELCQIREEITDTYLKKSQSSGTLNFLCTIKELSEKVPSPSIKSESGKTRPSTSNTTLGITIGVTVIAVAALAVGLQVTKRK